MAVDRLTGRFISPFSVQGAGLPAFDPGLIRPRENLPGTRLGRAIGRGTDELIANLGSAVEGVGVALESQRLQEFGGAVRAQRQAAAARSRAMEMDTTTGMLVDLVGEQIPQFVGTLGLTAAGAAVGALAGPGGAVAGGAAGRAAAAGAGVGGRAVAALAGQAAGAGARRGLQAGVAASVGFNYGIHAGVARETQRAENERNNPGQPINEGMAFAAAVPAAALDTLSGMLGGRIALRAALNQTRGRSAREAARVIGGNAALGAAIEGPTEVAQQAIMRAQAGQALASEEAMQEYAMAGFAGAFLGGTLGGAGGAISAMRRPAAQVTPEDIQTRVDQALAGGPAAPAAPPALPAPAPIAQRSTEELMQGLEQLQRREIAGTMDAQDLRLRQIIQTEIAAREQATAPVDPGQPVPPRFEMPEGQQELFPGVVAEQQAQNAARLAQMQPEPAPQPQQTPDPATDLFPETTPQVIQQRQEAMAARDRALLARELELEADAAARAAAERAPVEEMRGRAALLGLNPRSAFAQKLEARTYPELVEAVLDGLELTNTRTAAEISAMGLGRNLDTTLARIAESIGIDRDLPAEIAQLRQERDQFAPDSPEFQLFNRRANDLEQRQQVLQEVMARREQAQAADTARQAEVARQAREAEAARQAQAAAVAEEARQRQRRIDEAAGVGRPNETALGAQLAELRRRQAERQQQAETTARREQEAAAAQDQRQEQQFREASKAAREQMADQAVALNAARPQAGIEARSPESVARMREGATRALEAMRAEGPLQPVSVETVSNISRVRLSDGSTIAMERRRTGWYVGGRSMGNRFIPALTKAVRAANRVRDGSVGSRLMRDMGAPQINFGRATQPGEAHTRAVEAAARETIEGWESAAQVEVFATVGDYIATGRASAATAAVLQNPSGTVRGLYDPERQAVVLFAENIGDPGLVQATVYHEMLGHFGLDEAFGAAREQLLLDMYRASPDLQMTVDLWQELRGDMYPNAPAWLQIEEAIAMLSEDGPMRATFLQQMRALFIKFARLMGFQIKLKESDVVALIAYSHEVAMAPRSAMRDLQGLRALGAEGLREATRGVDLREMQAVLSTYPDAEATRAMAPRLMRVTQGVPDTPQGDETVLRRLMSAADVGVRRVTNRSLSEMGRKALEGALYFQSMGHIVTQYGRLFSNMAREGFTGNALKYLEYARDIRVAAREVTARLSMGVYDRYNQLKPKHQEHMTTLMSMTAYQLDPSRPLSDHTHLTPQEQADRAEIHARGVEAYRAMGRDVRVYEDAKRVMEAAYLQQHALDLHDLIVSNQALREAIPSASAHPMQKFLENPQVHNSPERTRDFWRSELDGLIRDSAVFVGRTSQTPTGAVTTEQQQRATLAGLLRDATGRIGAEVKAMENYPYFHMGRFGKYYASFNLMQTTLADGRKAVDPKTSERVAEALSALGYDNVSFSETPSGPVVYIRTDTTTQADEIMSLANRLKAEGLVDPESTPVAGDVDPIQMLPESARSTVRVLVQDLESQYAPLNTDDVDTRKAKAEHLARVKADIQTALMNRLPDMSTAKVMAHRKFRAGFDKDFMRSFAVRSAVSTNAGAERLASSLANDAFRQMMSDARQARGGDERKWMMNAVVRELMRREERTPDTMATSFLDGMRAFNHNYFLAFNPGYTTTQIAQLQINLWPELVKTGISWKDAGLAVMRAGSPALRIMTTVLADAKARGFSKYGADATLTLDLLNTIQMSPNPAIDAEMKTFLMGVYRRGQQDLGSSSRNLGQRAEGNQNTRFDTAMKWASSYNYHLEVLTRNISALSAYEVGKKKGLSGDALLDFASTVVRESMLNYREDNRARAFGRQGVLGNFTPLSTAFLTFQHHMLEKYYREFTTALKGLDPAERKAAQRWLVSHTSAMTVLAGSLGLPFVTVAARLLGGLVEMLDDSEEPVDLRIGWRNFLSDTFGEGVGEVLARGLPRAAGFDISSRVGAADFFPFSRLIDDRRDWETALGDMAQRMMGAPTSLVTGLLSGGQKISQGQVLDGMREALPLAFRNPLEAVRMSQVGMTDRRGNVLPIEPQTRDIIVQALGLTPAQRAEYSEANFSQAVRRNVVGTRATSLRRAAVRAIQAGDQEALREAVAAIRTFDEGVAPDLRIMPGLARALRQGVTRTEVARMIQQPLGVSPSDLVGREMTRFANFR